MVAPPSERFHQKPTNSRPRVVYQQERSTGKQELAIAQEAVVGADDGWQQPGLGRPGSIKIQDALPGTPPATPLKAGETCGRADAELPGPIVPVAITQRQARATRGYARISG